MRLLQFLVLQSVVIFYFYKLEFIANHKVTYYKTYITVCSIKLS